MDAVTGQNGLEQARQFTKSGTDYGIGADKAGWHREGRDRDRNSERAWYSDPGMLGSATDE